MELLLIFSSEKRTGAKERAKKIAQKHDPIVDGTRYKVLFRERSPDLIKLLDLCKDWKATEVYVDNEEINPTRALRILDCPSHSDCDGFCRITYWASEYARLLQNILEGISGEYDSYRNTPESLKEQLDEIEQISQNEDGSYSLDRENLKKAILEELELPLKLCDRVNTEKIFAQIDQIPESFTIVEGDFPPAEDYIEEEEFENRIELAAPIFAKEISKGLNYVVIANFGPEGTVEDCIEKGEALYYLERYGKSLKFFKKALEIDPINDYPWYKIGQCFFELEDFGEAVTAFEHAHAISPDSSEILNSLGLAYGILGDYSKSINCFNRILDMDPENDGAIELRELFEREQQKEENASEGE